MREIFAADPAIWVGDLGHQILGHLHQGRIVVWRSVSSATLTIANIDVGGGAVETYGIRHCDLDPMATDGIPLLLGRIEATSCGLWAATGYRSSRPVVVHALDGPGEPLSTYEVWIDQLRLLADSGEDPLDWMRGVPKGHPQEPCPVPHCPVTARSEA